MGQKWDVAEFQQALVEAFDWDDEERARGVVARFGEQPRRARAALEEMLESPDASVRRAGAFGLGELGGTASVKRLEEQMSLEEAREDYDGSSVLEVITEALGRIKGSGARSTLLRRFKRVVARKPSGYDLDEVTYALWQKRHPDLIPEVRAALAQIEPKLGHRLRMLLHLLETSPDKLAAWLQDRAVPASEKTDVLTLLDFSLPDDFLPILPAFIAAGRAVQDAASVKDSAEAEYCERLFVTLMIHWKRVEPALSAEERGHLQELARLCITSADSSCNIRAAGTLGRVGTPEDIPLLDAHRPEHPVLNELFDKAIRAIRNRNGG